MERTFKSVNMRPVIALHFVRQTWKQNSNTGYERVARSQKRCNYENKGGLFEGTVQDPH